MDFTEADEKISRFYANADLIDIVDFVVPELKRISAVKYPKIEYNVDEFGAVGLILGALVAKAEAMAELT